MHTKKSGDNLEKINIVKTTNEQKELLEGKIKRNMMLNAD